MHTPVRAGESGKHPEMYKFGHKVDRLASLNVSCGVFLYIDDIFSAKYRKSDFLCTFSNFLVYFKFSF